MSIETTKSPTPNISKDSKGRKASPKNSGGKKGGSKNLKKPAPKLPLYNFMSLELSSKKNSAAIIKINQLVGDDNKLTPATSLFSNNGKEISDEALSYHKISAEMVANKPVVSEFDFNNTQFLVFWDGEVARNLLRTNKVKKYAPIINLQTLARHLNVIAKPIKLIDYAKEALPQKRLQLEIKMRNPNSKIDVLPDILDYIKRKYLAKFGDDSPRFLSVLSRAKNGKDFEERLNKYIAIRDELAEKAAKSNKGKKPTDAPKTDATTSAKKVINVTMGLNSNKNNTIKVAIVKRK